MPYREEPEPTTSPLDAKVAAGERKLAEAARARRAEEDARPAREAAERERWFAEACARRDAWISVSPGMAVATAALGCYLTFLFQLAPAVYAVLLVALALVLGVRLVSQRRRRATTAATVIAERAWVAALPFAVTDYAALFTDSVRRPSFCVGLRFVASTPELATIEALFANLADQVSVDEDDGVIAVRWELPRGFGDSGYKPAVRVLFHRVVDEMLVPLHGQDALSAIEPRIVY